MSSSAIRAGRAFIELFLKDGVSKALVPVENRLKGFGDKVRSIGGAMAAMGAMGSAPMALSAKNFANFETTMANVATVLEDPPKHLERMSKEVKALAIEFGESTDTIGAGLYEILSATIAPEDAMTVLRAAMISAKGGVTDTAQATNMLISILNAYKIPAKDAVDVTDLLFAVMKRGTTTLPELAQHIGNVVSSAKACEITIEEMGAAIATMTRNGVKTDMAMTALNNMLLQFATPGKEAAEVAKEFGIDLSVAGLKATGFLGMMEKLNKLPKDVMAKIFPDARGIRGVFTITDDAAGFIKDMEEMKNRGGSALVAFNNHVDTTSVHLGQLWEVAKEFSVTIGSALAPKIARTALIARTLIHPITELLTKHKMLIQVLATAASATFLLGSAMLGIGAVVSVVVAIVSAMLATLLNPLTFVLAAVAAIGAAVAVGGAVWLAYSDTAKSALKGLGDSISYLSYLADEAFMGMSDALAGGDMELAANIGMLGLKAIWAQGLSDLASMFGGEWAQILRLLLSGDLAAAGTHAMAGFNSAMSTGMNLLDMGWRSFIFETNESLLAMGIDLGAFWEGICNTIIGIIDTVQSAIQSVADWEASWSLTLGGGEEEAQGEQLPMNDLAGEIQAGHERGNKRAQEAAAAERRKKFEESLFKNRSTIAGNADASAKNAEDAKAKADSAQSKAFAELNAATERARELREEQNKKMQEELAAAKADREKRAAENAAKVVPVSEAAEEADKKAQNITKENGTFSAAGAIAMAGREGSEVTDLQRQQYKEAVALNKKIDRLLQEMNAQNRKLGLPAIFT